MFTSSDYTKACGPQHSHTSGRLCKKRETELKESAAKRSHGGSLPHFPLEMIALMDIIGCRLVFVFWVVMPCGWDYGTIRRNNPKDLVPQQSIGGNPKSFL
jgi:hypothetical protein